jgi:hypothetical protein
MKPSRNLLLRLPLRVAVGLLPISVMEPGDTPVFTEIAGLPGRSDTEDRSSAPRVGGDETPARK